MSTDTVGESGEAFLLFYLLFFLLSFLLFFLPLFFSVIIFTSILSHIHIFSFKCSLFASCSHSFHIKSSSYCSLYSCSISSCVSSSILPLSLHLPLSGQHYQSSSISIVFSSSVSVYPSTSPLVLYSSALCCFPNYKEGKEGPLEEEKLNVSSGKQQG